MSEIKTAKILKDKKFSPGKIIGTLAVLAIVVIVAATSFKVVPAGHSGVVVSLGKVSTSVLSEGLHFKVPFVQKIEVISNKINNKEVAAQAVSKDLQSVSSTIAVNYRIEHAMSAEIYKNLEGANPDSVLLPAIQESMKAVSAKYTAEELISKRTQVSLEIKETLEDKVSEYGVFVERFNIVNFDFSEDFNRAIEEKQVAEQNLIKTKTEQEQQIVIANAEAQKRVIEAQAEADAISAKSQAQADANNRLTQSLSEILVEYEKVQKWNGELPMVSGDGTPIIDMRGAE